MSTAVANFSNVDELAVAAAKASLLEGFEHFLGKVPDTALKELAVFGQDGSLFWALLGVLDSPDIKKLTPRIRNQIAYAKQKGKAFEQVKACYELLDSQTVCAVLGISRQALSKKVRAGHVLAYTNGSKKHYPAFQFQSNAVIPEVAKLIKETGVELNDDGLSLLVGFMGGNMDFSALLEPENNQPRYTLLKNEAAFTIIIRDFKNRLEMGK